MLLFEFSCMFQQMCVIKYSQNYLDYKASVSVSNKALIVNNVERSRHLKSLTSQAQSQRATCGYIRTARACSLFPSMESNNCLNRQPAIITFRLHQIKFPLMQATLASQQWCRARLITRGARAQIYVFQHEAMHCIPK